MDKNEIFQAKNPPACHPERSEGSSFYVMRFFPASGGQNDRRQYLINPCPEPKFIVLFLFPYLKRHDKIKGGTVPGVNVKSGL